LDNNDSALVLPASDLLAGREFGVYGDGNPETIAPYRALAEHMGVAVRVVNVSGSSPWQIVLSPPPKH
jgi:hypothetical protein